MNNGSKKAIHIRAAACLLAFFALAALSCAPKPKKPEPIAPTAKNSHSVRELGMSFTPPNGWIQVDDALVAETRKKAAGQKQLGCFDASLSMAFFGPAQEQFIVSGLAPNSQYDATQSAISQMTRHSAILKSYFSTSGKTMADRIEINGYTVNRITGKDDAEYFSKYLFLDAKDSSSPAFSIDVVVPVDSYSETTNEEIGKSILTFRKE
jgi:hypothetical protein